MPRLSLLFAFAVLGCNGSNDPPVYRVAGRLIDTEGKPVSGVTVTFTATANGKLYPARGLAGEDGRFQMTTFSPNDGAVAGDHPVSINSLPVGENEPIPPQYSEVGLTAKIEPRSVNEITLKLERLPTSKRR